MIAIDIGNTSIHCGIVDQTMKIKTIIRLPTARTQIADIRGFLEKYPSETIVVCSVVPAITKIFEALKRTEINRTIKIAGKDLIVPIKCFYNKKNVGMDRIVGAFAAKILYPRSRIIIDFGSAITFDFLSRQGDYKGGFILPGIGFSLRALSSCALLPNKIILKKTRQVIPRNTQESISKGIEEGFSSMINSLVFQYKKILGILPVEKVVITGGDASLLREKFMFPYICEPCLVLKGLILLYQNTVL